MALIGSKFMRILARGCELCVCSEGCSDNEGACVVLERAKTDDHQLWAYEETSNTLRNKANDKCLTLTDDGHAHLETYNADKQVTQAVELKEGRIVAKNKGGKAVMVKQRGEGERLCLGECSEALAVWNFSNESVEQKLFWLSPEDRPELVVAPSDETRVSGHGLILLPKKEGSRHYDQLWYEDTDGVLKLSHYHLVIDAKENGEVTFEHQEPHKGNQQTWKAYPPTIYLVKKMDGGHEDKQTWLTILDSSVAAGAKVGAAPRKDAPQQRWSRTYYDTAE